MANTLLKSLHIKYIQSLEKNKDDLAYHMTTHLRLNGIYWGLTALCTLGAPEDTLSRSDMVDFVMNCWDEEYGGFGAHPGHDAHILGTLSAIQILVIQDALQSVNIPRVTKFILGLQDSSGAFAGDRFGETDTRFLYCSVNALALLGQLNKLDEPFTSNDGVKSERTRRELAIAHIISCRNFDGGFGLAPGAESHAGQVFVCVAALAILDQLKLVDHDIVGSWLAERQTPSGGLNGRPQKLEDVCYGFWVLSGLSILNRLRWIDANKVIAFTLSAQDPDKGGIADRPDNAVDVFHTHFGICGLSLLGYPGLNDVDPVFCMPADIIKKLGLNKRWTALPRRKEYNG